MMMGTKRTKRYIKRFAVSIGSQTCSRRSWITRVTRDLSDSEGENIVGLMGDWGWAGLGHGMRVGEENMEGKRDLGFGRR